MGLGQLFNRDVQYVATDTSTGMSETFTVSDLSPSWGGREFQGGMSIPGAQRASTLLADLLGLVPWDAYRERAGEPVEKLTPTPPLLDQPAPPETRMTSISSLALDLIWHGNAIALVAERNREGWPTALVPVPAEFVQVKRTSSRDGTAFPVGTIVYDIGGTWHPGVDVFHVKGPCRPSALRGMGVLENHLTGTLALAEDQARSARAVGTSGVPTGVLKSSDPDFEEADAKALKAAWLESQRRRTIAVLSATTEFQPVAWNPSETQLLDARRFTLHEIALIFGLDPSWLGAAQASRTYSNIEQEAINLIKFSLSGHLARFEQAFTAHLPRGTWAEANLDAVLRSDTLNRYRAHQIGIGSGFLTPDEARSLERRPPLTPAQREELQSVAPLPASAGQAPDDEEDA